MIDSKAFDLAITLEVELQESNSEIQKAMIDQQEIDQKAWELRRLREQVDNHQLDGENLYKNIINFQTKLNATNNLFYEYKSTVVKMESEHAIDHNRLEKSIQ